MPASAAAEAFEFQRTVSRLAEMQSRDWLEAWAVRHRAPETPSRANRLRAPRLAGGMTVNGHSLCRRQTVTLHGHK